MRLYREISIRCLYKFPPTNALNLSCHSIHVFNATNMLNNQLEYTTSNCQSWNSPHVSSIAANAFDVE